jgi:hypothetical protein
LFGVNADVGAVDSIEKSQQIVEGFKEQKNFRVQLEQCDSQGKNAGKPLESFIRNCCSFKFISEPIIAASASNWSAFALSGGDCRFRRGEKRASFELHETDADAEHDAAVHGAVGDP